MKQYWLWTDTSLPHGGWVTPAPGWFDELAPIPLEAHPTTGYVFLEWVGDALGADSRTTFPMTAPTSTTAIFGLLGDLSGDDDLTTADVRMLLDRVLGKGPSHGDEDAGRFLDRLADVTGDGRLSIRDVVLLVKWERQRRVGSQGPTPMNSAPRAAGPDRAAPLCPGRGD